MGEMRNTYNILVRNPQETDYKNEVGANLLIWMLEELGSERATEFEWTERVQ